MLQNFWDTLYIELLIDLIESFESFLWRDWVDSYALSSMIEFIGIFKFYRFMWAESIHFHILPATAELIDLAWVVYKSGSDLPATGPRSHYAR